MKQTFLIRQYFSIKMAQKSNISVRSLGSNEYFSVRHHAITRGVARFAKLTTNMAVRGRLRKVSAKFSKLFATPLNFTLENIHPSGNQSNEKTFF